MFDLINIGTYIALIMVVLAILYAISRCVNYQSNLLEGLTNPNENKNTMTTASKSEYTADTYKKNVTTLKDNMHLDTKKGHYEEILIQLEEWCDLTMLDLTTGDRIDVTKGSDDKNILQNLEIIKKVNDIAKFKANLNDPIYKYLHTTTT